MGDLFSTFNPETMIMGIKFSGNWFAGIRVIFFFPQIFWIQSGKGLTSIKIIFEYIQGELVAVYGALVKPGVFLLLIGVFFFIIIINFIGLTPYVFTPSSHLSFTLSLALPLWIGYICIRMFYQFNHIIAHLVPEGTPGVLIPLMVMIESVRIIIRPLTLAVRLAANIIAGHLLLSLIGGQAYNISKRCVIFLILGLRILIILECAVACIQAYVFIILSGLYANDHNTKKINI